MKLIHVPLFALVLFTLTSCLLSEKAVWNYMINTQNYSDAVFVDNQAPYGLGLGMPMVGIGHHFILKQIKDGQTVYSYVYAIGMFNTVSLESEIEMLREPIDSYYYAVDGLNNPNSLGYKYYLPQKYKPGFSRIKIKYQDSVYIKQLDTKELIYIIKTKNITDNKCDFRKISIILGYRTGEYRNVYTYVISNDKLLFQDHIDTCCVYNDASFY